MGFRPTGAETAVEVGPPMGPPRSGGADVNEDEKLWFILKLQQQITLLWVQENPELSRIQEELQTLESLSVEPFHSLALGGKRLLNAFFKFEG